MLPAAQAGTAEVPVVIPDAGPCITLAHADALELLAAPGWPVWMVDMVLAELTRSETPTSARIAEWIRSRDIPLVPSEVCRGPQDADSAISARWPSRRPCRRLP